MKATTRSSVPVYTVSGSPTARPLPEWLARKRKRSLKQDPEYANRIELLQDFEFEEASSCIRVSPDGDWVMSTGTYKPQIHVHHLPQLSLSFARHTNSLNQTFVLLSSDYSKSLHLQADRTLEFHTPGGCHYSTRIPRYGRDVLYDKRSTEALVPTVGVNGDGNGEVFRLNLELGRFMKAYEVDVGGDDSGSALQGGVGAGSVNTATIAEDTHNLLAFGTSLGSVEFWDPRSRSRVGILSPPSTPSSFSDARPEITALEFHQQDGLTLATGTSDGIVHLYDLRSPTPTVSRDQGYGFPIQNLIFLASSRENSAQSRVLSADKRIIKIWDQHTGDPWTSVEPAVDLHHVAWVPDSGMLLTANEGRQQHSFFIPSLGPAPRWCAVLDNLVEELAEDQNDANAFGAQQAGQVYDNYKFLTEPQLKALNIDHLVSTTSVLRPYMHGFFVPQKLYEEARIISNPDAFLEQRQKSIQSKINAERESRIRGNKQVKVKVNRRMAEKLMEREEKNERRKARRLIERGGDEQPVETSHDGQAPAIEAEAELGEVSQPAKEPTRLLTDSRFAQLFQDEDFEVDENSREFQQLNPSTQKEENARIPKGLTAAQQEMLEDRRRDSDSDEDEDDDNDSDDSDGYDVKRQAQHQSTKNRTQRPQNANKFKPPQMSVSSSNKRTQPKKDNSFGSRVAQQKDSPLANRPKSRVVGEKEVTFAPTVRTKQSRQDRREDGQNDRRREVGKDRRSASGNVFRRM